MVQREFFANVFLICLSASFLTWQTGGGATGYIIKLSDGRMFDVPPPSSNLLANSQSEKENLVSKLADVLRKRKKDLLVLSDRTGDYGNDYLVS